MALTCFASDESAKTFARPMVDSVAKKKGGVVAVAMSKRAALEDRLEKMVILSAARTNPFVGGSGNRIYHHLAGFCFDSRPPGSQGPNRVND